MLKPSYGSVVLFLIIKTVVFSVLIAFVDKRYISYVTDAHRDGGLFQNTISYIVYIIIYGIIPPIIFFSGPLYASLFIKQRFLFIASILIIFVLDYGFESWGNGFVNNLERFYFWICSLTCFLILFHRHIKNKFQ